MTRAMSDGDGCQYRLLRIIEKCNSTTTSLSKPFPRRGGRLIRVLWWEIDRFATHCRVVTRNVILLATLKWCMYVSHDGQVQQKEFCSHQWPKPRRDLTLSSTSAFMFFLSHPDEERGNEVAPAKQYQVLPGWWTDTDV